MGHGTREESARVLGKVVPGASRSRVVGFWGDALKVQVAAAPAGGEAREEGCAGADVVVFEPASDEAKFNPAYDNLYRPGNAIWALRQLRLANPETAYESPLLETGSMSVASSAEVARPLEVFRAENARANQRRYFK